MLNPNLTSVENAQIPEDLSFLLEDFNKKFDEAFEARKKIINYLEFNYDYDSNDYSFVEDNNTWIFGINEDSVKNIINNPERSNA